ncbi:MAG TPA: serine/threonine-protein kinase [Longimicrobiaceae bacterium]|nr:serine/threonine-protein kinase [Longimicrobiaceae bacterium]
MSGLSDAALEHLRRLAAEPEADGEGGFRYALREEVGRGGMGVVYRARDRELGRDVALKALPAPADPALVERLQREARILARLDHPGVVPVHDAGALPDGRPFYVMKLVRGERLDAWARGRALAERLRTFLRVCEPVAFAHARGVVHRDLKPQNVMVGAFGEVLVMDWGVARLRAVAEDDPGVATSSTIHAGETAHGTVLGTPGFMAPEQARGEVHRVDERTDVFALGAILRGLMAGEPHGRALAAVAAKAAAPEPEARYAAVADLAADVQRWLDGEPVSAHRESVAERAGRLYRRYQTPVLLVLAYLLMRVLLLLFQRDG